MNIGECEPGDNVILRGRYITTMFGGVVATITDTRRAPDLPQDNPAYPHGMVQVLLPQDVDWPTHLVWVGPEDLIPGGDHET